MFPATAEAISARRKPNCGSAAALVAAPGASFGERLRSRTASRTRPTADSKMRAAKNPYTQSWGRILARPKAAQKERKVSRQAIGLGTTSRIGPQVDNAW